jgi:RND family efflux transporter MFP subunit
MILSRFLAAAALVLAAPMAARAEPVDCVMEPRAVVDLASSETGLIADIPVSRGDRVREGDVLLRLDDTLQRLQLDLATARLSDVDIRAAEARLAALQRTLDRARELASRNAAPATAVEEAEIEVDLARLSVEQARSALALAGIELATAQALLDRRTIRSPIAGLVTEVVASPGEFATEQARLLSVADIDPLRVEAFVSAEYFGRLQVGQEFEVVQTAPLEGRFGARLTVVDQVFDAASSTFGVRLEIDNPEGAIPAGVRCSVNLNSMADD